MTRKHFESIAGVFNNNMPMFQNTRENAEAFRMMANEMADMCANQNPRFDHERFIRACGLTPA